ncbi:MAG: SOUL family heme-binding protein [Crocinitomicaceae bacterium]
MKVLYIILILLFSGFVFSQVYIERSTSRTEQVDYKVVKRLSKGVEIRKYEDLIVAYTKISADNYGSVSSKGFRRIAGYIFGGNEGGESIAMTAPVQMNFADTSEMMFFMPKSYRSMDALPTPNDSTVRIKEIKERTVAAIVFKGWASDKTIDEQKKNLVKVLESEGIAYDANDFAYLGYNPPYQMANRRNEIIVTLKE